MFLKRKESEAEICGSTDDTLLLKPTKQFHTNLYRDPVEEVTSGVVPQLFEFLKRDDYPQLQCEAALAIKGISNSSSDMINTLIDHGSVPIMVSLLSSPKDVLRGQALHVLGKFAVDSTKSRDIVLSYGVLMPLLAQFNDETKLYITRKAMWTFSLLCAGKPKPQFEQMKPAILPLAHLIHTEDDEVLQHACWALANLSLGEMDGKQAVIDAGVFPRLVELLLSPSHQLLRPALYTVANIIPYVDVIQIQVFIDNGALPFLLNLLTQNYENIVKKNACGIISSIIRRTKDHIQAVIEAGIISPLLQLLQNADFSMKIPLVRAFCFAITNGTNEQIKFLVHEGCIKSLCDLLVSPNEARVIKLCLEGFENILKVGEAEKNQGNTEDTNVFAQMIDDAGGLQKIKNLQTHDNSEICEIAVKLLETYWQKEDDEQLLSGDAPQSVCFLDCN
ncbi:importin subunit alpha [Olea europaea subsp. europaea]|uniref:Importin subunit alpha n=1 Tax=Olea europaea subsp. europaea TaxID=158383 RepID=A0A8S0QUM0_OLEEU|nr:importin subunit alpha [Olea europaea subsp. europaea]